MVKAILGGFLLLLTACALPDNLDKHDRDQAMTRSDYRDALQPYALPKDDAPPAFVPIPPAPEAPQKLVTLSLDGTMPIKDVFIELAHQADLDLEMDAGISAPPVIFTAKRRPFNEVVERLTSQTGLRANIDKNVLRIEKDDPYLKSYRVDYPNIARATNSSISSSLNIANASEGNNSNNDSASSTDNKSEAHFWAELDQNLAQLLQVTDKDKSTYSLNKQAGIVSVRGTEDQQRMVADYLQQLAAASQAQVLIEARILEVSLNDEFSSGINWNTVLGGAFEAGFNAPAGIPTVALSPVPSRLPGVSLNITDENFQGLVNFLQNFGTVRALSSPRMTVMQNQVGVIKVVQNDVYFRLTIETTDATDNSPARRDVTSEQRTVPVGLIMNVQPSIDLDTGRVTMALRPTITRVAERRSDPAILIAASDAGLTPEEIDSTVPVVAVQEMESVVSMQTGQTLVMGGLMRDTTTAGSTGIPGTGEVPILNFLTNSRDDSTRKSELVVFLKATIVNHAASTISEADRDLYYRFGADRRPISADLPSKEPKNAR